MRSSNRRAFLQSSTAGLASVLFAGHNSAADTPIEVAPPPRPVEKLPTDLLPQDTLFLTWHRDPTTTIVAQWLGTTNANLKTARVAQNAGTGPWKVENIVTKVFGNTPLKVHRCEFTGLKPGTEHILQIGENKQVYRFRTMPAKANDTFTWVSGGDCGVNAAAVATNISAAKQEPYFALIAGDLGYDNGTSAKTAVGFLQNYSKHMIDPKGRLIPLVTTLGNHEVKGGYKGKRADATFYFPLFDGLYRETSYGALDFGDYLSLVLLDSGHISPIGGAQTEWLDSALAEREDRPHVFVANHVPAYPAFRSPTAAPNPGWQGLLNKLGVKEKPGGTGDENRKFWCPLFEKHVVDAVLEHHDHVFKRTHALKDGLKDKYGVPYLGDGSWGQLRSPATPEQRPYLAKVARAYHMTVHKLEGDQRYHIAMESNGTVADVFSTTGKRPHKRG